jgi:hypothetical protein
MRFHDRSTERGIITFITEGTSTSPSAQVWGSMSRSSIDLYAKHKKDLLISGTVDSQPTKQAPTNTHIWGKNEGTWGPDREVRQENAATFGAGTLLQYQGGHERPLKPRRKRAPGACGDQWTATQRPELFHGELWPL